MSKQSAFHNLYTRFEYNQSKSPVDILKGTKNLIVHSSTYNSYSRDYTNLTQTSTFKSPEIEEYPILKNTTFIPLRCQTATTRNPTKPPIKKLLLQLNDNPSTSNTRNKHNNNKNGICFITETESKRRCQTARNERRKYHLNTNHTHTLKYKEDIFSLLDILFKDDKYEHLYYDESVIFHNEEHYITYIEQTVEQFKKNKNENHCYHLDKTYFNTTDEYVNNNEHNNNNINSLLTSSKLSLHSMTINFINLTDKTKPPITFSIPFALLPVFYYKNFQNIKYILLSLIQFSSTYDSITLNEDEFYNLLINSIEFNNKPITNEKKSIKFLKMNTKIPNNNNINNKAYGNLYSKKMKITQTYHKTKLLNQQHHQHQQWKYLNTLTNYWIAGEYLYKIEIKVPEITVNVRNKQITKYIDAELLLFLLEHNFVNWDFYIIHYLFSIKYFRTLIVSILSKHNNNTTHFKDINHIRLSHIKTNCLSLKENTYYFYYTFNHLKNYLCVIHSYSIIILDKRVIPKREHIFKLALDRMKTILDISKKETLPQFFQKILTINKTNLNVDLNIDILDDFNPSEYYYYKTNEHNNVKYDECSLTVNKKESNTHLNKSSKALLFHTPIHSKKIDYMNTNTMSVNNHNNMEEYSIYIHHPYIELIEYISIKEANENVHNHRGSNVNCIYSDNTEYIHKVIKQDVLEKICNEKEIKNIIKLLVECKLANGGCTFTYDVGTKQRKATKKKASVLGNMIQAPKRSSIDSNRTL